jgi:hypothetical protein
MVSVISSAAFFWRLDLISTSDQKESLDKAQLKELLYEEVVSFVPSI